MKDQANAFDQPDAAVTRFTRSFEQMNAIGRYEAVCIAKDGSTRWRDFIDNVVVTEGKNFALDTFLASTAYVVTGPFMGLVSSVGYSSIVAADTMASHAGWTESGSSTGNAPAYTGNRKTAVFSAAAAGSKALSAALSFAISSSGTVKGAFMTYGTGAVNTKDSTAGVLLSAGLFSGGDKVVGNGDTLNVSWSLAL